MQWRQDPDSQAQRPADAIAHRAVGWVGTGDVAHPVAWMSSSVIRVGGEPAARHTGLEQPAISRVSLAVGSAPWFIGATQSWRAVAALRSRPTVRRYRRIWGKSRSVGCHSP